MKRDVITGAACRAIGAGAPRCERAERNPSTSSEDIVQEPRSAP